MTSEQKKKCHSIIHAASLASAAAGVVSLPVSVHDTFIISSAQITMIIGLGAVFGKTIGKTQAEAIAAGALGRELGRYASKTALGFFPGIGNIANGVIAASLTESFGWVVAKQFDSGKI